MAITDRYGLQVTTSSAGQAREAAAGTTRPERQHVEALSVLIAGETARGLALVDEHVAECPRDAVLVNQAGNAVALADRSDREEHRVAFIERLAPAYGDEWRFKSALAFTYHEVDRFEETMVACYLSVERYDDVIRLVRRRLERRASPRDLGWLDRASAGLAAQQGTPGESR
jgi:hypothetical protein